MVYHGKVQNGTIVLEDGERLPEGTNVRIEPLPPSNKPPRGSVETILASAGFWAGDEEEVDRLLAELKEMKQTKVKPVKRPKSAPPRGSYEAIAPFFGMWADQAEDMDRSFAELRKMKEEEVRRQRDEPDPQL
ncbi:MAG: hypothetical protein FWD53_08060 [Phycisphaerales bacterium]|nr:hypothetical protein [Phycisphaerales bacterium]